jgi:predicted O-linked N-acetylglucosamine transferase (SPINDLY family)
MKFKNIPSSTPRRNNRLSTPAHQLPIFNKIFNEKGVDALLLHLKKLASQQSNQAFYVTNQLHYFAASIQRQDPKSALSLALIAIELNSENIPAWLLAGAIQDKLGERTSAAESMRHVVRSPTSKPEQVLRAANLLVRFGEHQEALNSAKTAFDQLGKPLHLATSLMYIAKLTADWASVEELKIQMTQGYANGLCAEIAESPRTHLLWCGDESINIEVIKNWSQRTIRLPEKVINPRPEPLNGRRIRLGYLSSDFREHPTSRLINGLLKHHDRSKFELFMYCSGWNDHSAMRQEIESQFEHQHAVAHLSDAAAAQLIRSHGIDVLIELNGPTRAHRMGILAHRPAPVQIDYLGWPGSVGGRVVDYIIGDGYTVPQEAEVLYPEKVIKLSKTYQVNDFASLTLPTKPTRQSVGLPNGNQLILGMFNAINKVDASVWATWMQIMQAVPNSLLWLLDPGPVACKFIAKETRIHGVDVKRIVIAPRMKQDAHLARMQCCDLMLDPWPYGGHTSTSDALFAGVPVISLQGTNFASRVSGSLLHAAGMGVMVQPDVNSYVKKAIHLLKNPQLLMAAKIFLKDKTPDSNLFNSKFKTKQLENHLIHILK